MVIIMSEELFDVLDSNGHPTGQVKPRTQVHQDGDWHRAIHIWIINHENEILLQRRAPDKDSDPNMLDISCAGHLSSGDDSLTGALRELQEELSLTIDAKSLQYIGTLKRSPYHDDDFVDNEFDDVYLLQTDKTINDLTYQKEEISEIMFISIPTFQSMIKNRQPDLVMYDDEYEILFKYLKDQGII